MVVIPLATNDLFHAKRFLWFEFSTMNVTAAEEEKYDTL